MARRGGVVRYRVSPCVIGLALAVAGCGGSGPASSDKSAAGVRSTMRAYLEDIKNSRGGDACDLLTDAAKAKAGGGDASACGARVLFARTLLGAKTISDFEAKIDQLSVTITGDHASMTGPTGGKGNFVYSGGRWLISTNG